MIFGLRVHKGLGYCISPLKTQTIYRFQYILIQIFLFLNSLPGRRHSYQNIIIYSYLVLLHFKTIQYKTLHIW